MLRGRTAIITGAGSGIGRATAILFAEEGANVVVADLDRHAGTQTVQRANGGNKAAVFVQTDVSDATAVHALVNRTVKRHGTVDILVNNAGTPGPHPVTETTEEQWDRVLAVNLKSVFLCSKAVLPYMMQQRRGAIVNTASAVGVIGSAGQASYCASKGGVVLLTKAMALDHAAAGIRVNCVCPGFTQTPMVERFLASFDAKKRAQLEESFRSLHPLGRFARPEEVARAILYLASDEASFVTGVALPVDGGWTAH